MIHYTYFRFSFARWKKEKTENHHVNCCLTAQKALWTDELFRFLITFSLFGKGSMDHTNVICLCQCFIWRTQNQSTTDGYRFHLGFLIIDNRKTKKVWFDSLFVFQFNDTNRQNKGRYKQKMLLFCFPLFMLPMKNENRYCESYFCCPFSELIFYHLFDYVYELGKRKRKINCLFPIFDYGIGKRKTIGWYI